MDKLLKNSPIAGDLRVPTSDTMMSTEIYNLINIELCKLKYYPTHIWNQSRPFIYEYNNRVPMLMSVTFVAIVTLRVWNSYWAHNFVACWIRWLCCVHSYLWPFRFVAVSVSCRSGLWPFRFVAFLVCGHFSITVMNVIGPLFHVSVNVNENNARYSWPCLRWSNHQFVVEKHIRQCSVLRFTILLSVCI